MSDHEPEAPELSNAQINGYWDEEEFYEVISFTQMPMIEFQ